jgi:hypothetical protein
MIFLCVCSAVETILACISLSSLKFIENHVLLICWFESLQASIFSHESSQGLKDHGSPRLGNLRAESFRGELSEIIVLTTRFPRRYKANNQKRSKKTIL